MEPEYKRNMWRDYVDDLRAKADIVDVILSEGVRIKKQERDWIGLSPFTRESHPSFRVSRNKQIFKCYSSGRGGTVLTFLMMRRGCSLQGAVKILAERYRFGYKRWCVEEKRKAHQKLLEIPSERMFFDRDVQRASMDTEDKLPF